MSGRLLQACPLLLAFCGLQAWSQGPSEALLYNNPYPKIERLLHQAERLLPPLAPQALAALPATPELLASAVLDPGVGRHFTNHLAGGRPLPVSVYGLWLAGQLGLQADFGQMRFVWQCHPGTVAAHLAVYLAHQAEPEEQAAMLARMQRADPALNGQARAIFEHRLPIGRAVVSRVLDGLARGIEPDQAALLRTLLSRIAPAGREEIAARWERLPVSVRDCLTSFAPKAAAPAGASAPSMPQPTAVRPPVPAGRPRNKGQAARIAAPELARWTADLPFWALCVAGGVVTLCLIRRVTASAALLLLAVTLGVAQGDEGEDRKPGPGDPPHRDLEELLQEAALVEQPVTALKLARLRTTPPLMARVVLDDHAASYLALGHPHLRPAVARLYGVFITFHVDYTPDRIQTRDVRYWHADTAVGHVAILLGRRLWPDNATFRGWEQQNMTHVSDRQLAQDVLRLRMPTDSDILAEIARRAGKNAVPTPAQLDRLGRLWHRLDESGREYLKQNRASLSPILRRMVELRGVESPKAGK